MAIPDGATCSFCLEEKTKEEPLVQECSYCGLHGIAHLACIAKYAKNKCKEATDDDRLAFTSPWIECPNCTQLYQNQL
jgi:hypothetical protein